MQSGYDITLTVIVSGPAGQGSVEYMRGGYRIFGGASYGVEFLEDRDLDEGREIVKRMTSDLENSGFRMVEVGPLWFQREFKREYVPGNIDYSATLHPSREEEGSRQPWRYWPREKGCLFYVFWALILFWVLTLIPSFAIWLLS